MNNTKEKFINAVEATNIAKNLQALMMERNVTETEIARTLNTSVMTVRRVISGETEDPRISTVQLIAGYFNVSIDSLLKDHGQSPAITLGTNAHQFVPVLDWETLIKKNNIDKLDLSKWKEWYPVVFSENQCDKDAFALRSRPSMYPRFQEGTLLIVSPAETPEDGDLVLINIKQLNELSLREFIIDSPKCILRPVIPGSEQLYYDATIHSIVGVIVLTVFHAKK